ncbi:MAG: phosphate-starvation-inducible PsiE family protein, partial [Solirubrobacteraceae bacterium]
GRALALATRGWAPSPRPSHRVHRGAGTYTLGVCRTKPTTRNILAMGYRDEATNKRPPIDAIDLIFHHHIPADTVRDLNAQAAVEKATVVPLRSELSEADQHRSEAAPGRTRACDESEPPRKLSSRVVAQAEGLMHDAEELVKWTVEMVLMGFAIFTVYTAIAALITTLTTSASAAKEMPAALDSILVAVILVEIKKTMQMEKDHLKLKGFLMIGIISAVREILVETCTSLHQISAGKVPTSSLDTRMAIVLVIGFALALRLVGQDKAATEDTSD